MKAILKTKRILSHVAGNYCNAGARIYHLKGWRWWLKIIVAPLILIGLGIFAILCFLIELCIPKVNR